jgi:hypothetical protein
MQPWRPRLRPTDHSVSAVGAGLVRRRPAPHHDGTAARRGRSHGRRQRDGDGRTTGSPRAHLGARLAACRRRARGPPRRLPARSPVGGRPGHGRGPADLGDDSGARRVGRAAPCPRRFPWGHTGRSARMAPSGEAFTGGGVARRPAGRRPTAPALPDSTAPATSVALECHAVIAEPGSTRSSSACG